jgi:hypothetical protein
MTTEYAAVTYLNPRFRIKPEKSVTLEQRSYSFWLFCQAYVLNVDSTEENLQFQIL